jgi:hypothetical protein
LTQNTSLSLVVAAEEERLLVVPHLVVAALAE